MANTPLIWYCLYHLQGAKMEWQLEDTLYPAVFEMFSPSLLWGRYRQGKAETLFLFSIIKTFCLGSPHYQLCLQHVQTVTALEHAQKMDFVTFIHDKWLFTSYVLTKVSRTWSRVCRYWFWILDQNPPSSQILHFSAMLVTVLTALILDVAGVPYWQLQFYWCYAAQDVQSYYVSRHRKCNSVTECIRRKEPFKVQGKCHYF